MSSADVLGTWTHEVLKKCRVAVLVQPKRGLQTDSDTDTELPCATRAAKMYFQCSLRAD